MIGIGFGSGVRKKAYMASGRDWVVQCLAKTREYGVHVLPPERVVVQQKSGDLRPGRTIWIADMQQHRDLHMQRD
jgi:hypothetical protein